MIVNAQGLCARILHDKLELSRDGHTRTESWPSAELMAERLRALGFAPEDLNPLTGE
jgi:hypothetical protein